jgi:alanine racemase
MTHSGYEINRFTEIIGGTLIQAGLETEIKHIVLDSRQFQVREGSVFFALSGDLNDGHQHAGEAFRKGIRNFVVSKDIPKRDFPGANIVSVSNTLSALQSLAGFHRARFNYPVLAITGSNGKTIVKEWLAQIVQGEHQVVKSPKSYNSQVGVPLSLWRMRPSHSLAIIEAGMSKPGEMHRLEKMIRPDWGIFTNIGPAHQENFESLRQKIDEKLRLFDRVSKLIYCKDHPEIAQAISEKWHGGGPEMITWSQKDSAADLHVEVISQDEGHTNLSGTYKGQKRKISIPFTYASSIENVCHCWLFLLELGISDQKIAAGMKGLAPVAMRLEQLAGIHGCVVINDVYNSDFASLEIALEHLWLQRKNKLYTVILSDIPPAGEDPDVLYSRVAELLRISKTDRLIGIGPQISSHAYLFAGIAATFYPTTEVFLADFRKDAFREENILIKGARHFAFERISERLEEKTHETILEIDLNRMAENLDYIRKSLKPSTKIMVMVKAFAYGSGGYEIARFLELRKVDYLAVAYADEGVDLRQAGIEIPILVLNPEVTSYDAMIRYRLEPQIFSFRTLHLFLDAVKKMDADEPFPIHLKINTGMNRLGFEPQDAAALGDMLKSEDRVKTISVFTHLAASENPDFDDRTAVQIERFTRASQVLSEKLDGPFLRHVLNSSGALRHPEAQMDMVRIGLALYGLTGSTEARKKLQPVSRLTTAISQIRQVPAGEGIGYSPKAFLEETRTIAVLPIGYADGMPRSLGNGNWSVYIAGKKVPFIGNICMDMSMVDVTGLRCAEGDEVEVFGEHCTIYDLAKTLNTIPYEVLTNVSTRVKRVFHQE